MTTPKSALVALVGLLRALCTDPAYFWIVGGLVILGDTLLTQIIIRFISYTEIDWETYMIHIQLFLKGERDYKQITGPTGPLVYPAGHVHIFHLLYEITNEGKNIALAQQIFGGLYIASLVIMCAVYRQAGAPNWSLVLLPLSKRLHSIFVLRLFNDCWATVAAQAATLAFQTGWDDLGTLLFSGALSVKMSVFLYLPGLLVVMVKSRGVLAALRCVITIALTQVIFALPFLTEHSHSYLHQAFDLSRVFLYKWTVNWRFLDEDTFLSPGLAKGLLIGHVSILVAFGWFRWCRKDGGVVKVIDRGFRRLSLPASPVPISGDEIATILFTSNLIGILFARSLHYQFYSWYAQQIPFLTCRTRYPIVLKLGLILSIEYAWNIFPSTILSSSTLVIANGFLLAGIWFGFPQGEPAPHTAQKSQ